MIDMSIPAEIESPLRRARAMRVTRSLARATVLVAMLVLTIEAAGGLIWAARHPESVHRFFDLLPIGRWLTLAAIPLLAIVAAYRYRRLVPLAQSAEQQFSALGWRLSTSLEAPQMSYCSPTIRKAIWSDAAAAIGSVAWSAFLERLSTAVWTVLAIALILIEFLIASPRTIASGPKSAKVPGDHQNADSIASIVPPLPQPSAEPPAFTAHLKITNPADDQWATKVEAIPLKIAGDSPLGFQNLKLSVSVNGGAEQIFPLDAASLAAGLNETSGNVYLDELTLQDYDVVAYSVIGEAIRPQGRLANVGAPMHFIQIRPFQKDIAEKNGGPGNPKDKLVDLLMQLIEDQRKVVKGTWLLQTNSDLDRATAAYHDMAGYVTRLQSDTLDLTRKSAGDIEAEGTNAAFVQSLNTAADQMQDALGFLRDSQWQSAVPSSEQALSTLVDLLRHTREMVVKNQKAAAAKNAPHQQRGLKDRQTVRKDNEAKTELEKLAREQDKLNQQIDAPNKQDEATKAAAQHQAADQQRDLSKRTNEAAADPKRSESARDLVKDAAKVMNENADKLDGKELPEPADDHADSSANPSSAGQTAAQRLRQADAAEAAEKSAGQAGQLKDMLDQLGKMQADEKRPGGTTPDSQKDNAAKLAEMAAKLDDLSASPAAKSPDDLKHAADSTAAAADRLDKGNGDDKTLAEPIDAVAKAYDKTTGQPAHLEQLNQEMGELQRQLEGLQNQMNRQAKSGKGEPSLATKEWEKNLADRGAGLKSELKIALGETPAVQRLSDQLKQMMNSQASPSAGKPTGKDPAGGDGQKVRISTPNTVVQGDTPKPEAGQKSGDGHDQSLPQPQPGQEPHPNPSGEPEKAGAAPAGDRATDKPDGKAPGNVPDAKGVKGTNDEPGEPSDGEGGTAHSVGQKPMVADLGPWRDTFAGVQAELDVKLQQVSPRDALRAMQADETPAEYREWVNAYYEKLSRQMPANH